jgi:hypothetical protein
MHRKNSRDTQTKTAEITIAITNKIIVKKDINKGAIFNHKDVIITIGNSSLSAVATISPLITTIHMRANEHN